MKKRRAIGGGLATDSLILTFVRVVTICVSLVQTMILSRVLSVNAYGTYSEGLLVFSFFSPVFSLGLSDAINYFYNRSADSDRRRDYISTIFIISMMAGVIGGITLLVFRSSICKYFDNADLFPVIPYIAFRPMLHNIVGLYQPLYISAKKAKLIALRNLIISIIQVTAIAIITYISGEIIWIFGCMLLLDLTQIIAFDYYLRRNVISIEPKRANMNYVGEIMRFALPVLLATSVGTINVNLDKLMISAMMTTEDYALYANVSKELPFSFIATSMTTVVAPTIISLLNAGDNNRFKMVWSDYLEFGYTVTWPLCLSAIVLAPEIVEFLYSSKYLTANGIMIFRIYMVAMMIQFTYFGLIPTALGETKTILRYSVMGVVLNLALNYTLFQAIGMVGPSIATVLSSLIPAVFYMKNNTQKTGTNILEVLKIKKLGILALQMTFASLITLVTHRMFLNEYSYIVRLFVGLSVFYLCMIISQKNNLMKLIKTLNKE